jgi:hypothetical protein
VPKTKKFCLKYQLIILGLYMTWPTSNPIARELDDFWKESQSLWQQYWYEADLDTKMATGQQDYWNTFYNVNYRNQKILMFNKILRIINMIGGYQRDNRLSTVIIPADNDPDQGETADQRTTVLNWVKRQDSTYERISECFDASNTCGLNLLSLWMDFREDPENGEIRTSRIPFNAFLMDNYWTKSDLSDCDRIWTRRYITKPQLKSLMPDIGKDINSLGKGYAAKDGKFQFLAQNWYQYQQEMYAYDEYWVRDYKTVRKILDTSTGEVANWKGSKDQFQMLLRMNPNVKIIKAEIPTVRLHILVNNHLVYEEKSPYGLDRFPFVPFVCYHYPEVQNYAYRYQGVVRNIRDSQIELNRRRNRLLDIMDAQVQSGLMVKEDALVNPEDAFMQGPGKVLYFKQTANLATDVAPIPAPPVAQGWMELIQTIEKEIMDIVGPEELFAQNMGAKEMTGVLMKLKMGAGLTGLRNIFDRLNQSQMYVGEIMDDMIINNFGTGKVANILGKEPTEYFFDNEFSRYQCTVEEAELTSSQRQLQFLQAFQMKQMGLPISDRYLIEKSTLQGKKELLEDMDKQAQQAEQMQQQQFQAEMQQSQVLARSLEAKAQSDFAGAEERKARAVSDIALAKERSSQAVHDRAAASLENAKALKEIEHMDDDKLIKLANFIVDLQMKQKQLQGSEEGDAIEEASALGSSVKQEEAQTRPQSNQQASN